MENFIPTGRWDSVKDVTNTLTTGEITVIKGKKTFRSFKTDLFIQGD